MATLASNNHVTELLAAGADAMSNMYEIHITPAGTASTLAGGGTAESLFKIRAKGFTPAMLNQSQYAVKYKSITVNRPGTLVEGERKFEIEFRLDAYYDAYKALKKWQQETFNPQTGYVSNSLTSSGLVKVYSLSTPIALASDAHTTGVSDGNFLTTNLLWSYSGVWVQQVTEPVFTTDSGEPLSVKATFYFSTVDGPSTT